MYKGNFDKLSLYLLASRVTFSILKTSKKNFIEKTTNTKKYNEFNLYLQ